MNCNIVMEKNMSSAVATTLSSRGPDWTKGWGNKQKIETWELQTSVCMCNEANYGGGRRGVVYQGSLENCIYFYIFKKKTPNQWSVHKLFQPESFIWKLAADCTKSNLMVNLILVLALLGKGSMVWNQDNKEKGNMWILFRLSFFSNSLLSIIIEIVEAYICKSWLSGVCLIILDFATQKVKISRLT